MEPVPGPVRRNEGQYRANEISHSRILEIDPTTNEVIWEYRGRGLQGWRFYSPIISGVQRLPHGNTWITEGTTRRLLEVTPDGRVAWEFTTPYSQSEQVSGGSHAAIFKARSYPPEFVESFTG